MKKNDQNSEILVESRTKKILEIIAVAQAIPLTDLCNKALARYVIGWLRDREQALLTTEQENKLSLLYFSGSNDLEKTPVVGEA